MNVLNLDELSQQTRTITIKGVAHEVVDMTVEDFIETSKAIEALKKAESDKNTTESDKTVGQVKHAIDMICRRVPTLTPADLSKLSMEKLSLIMKFIQGEMDEKVTTEGSKGEDPEKK